jgi:hypothetical protein
VLGDWGNTGHWQGHCSGAGGTWRGGVPWLPWQITKAFIECHMLTYVQDRNVSCSNVCSSNCCQPPTFCCCCCVCFHTQVFVCARNEQDVAATVKELTSQGHNAQVALHHPAYSRLHPCTLCPRQSVDHQHLPHSACWCCCVCNQQLSILLLLLVWQGCAADLVDRQQRQQLVQQVRSGMLAPDKQPPHMRELACTGLGAWSPAVGQPPWRA